MLLSAAERLHEVLARGPEALRAEALVCKGAPALTDARLLRLADEVLGEEMRRYPDGRMLIWDIAREDGYTIPPYPMAGCGDVREFLRDEGARDVPDWYERHLGMPREAYGRMYERELVMVRNRARWRRVWEVPAPVMQGGSLARLGGPVWRALEGWLTFALGEQDGTSDARLFKR